MRIGLLAELSGLSVDTIRFYEKKGLLDPDLVVRQSNKYRDYSQGSLERLIFIQQAKSLGFTLNEIQEWIQGIKNDQLTATEKCEIINRKLQEIDERIEKLIKIKIPLTACLDKYYSDTK